ncbi:MAG: hypothetical protein WBJ13_04800 [Sedimentibacter sp.]
MKNKYLYIAIPFIVYIIILIVSNKYSIVSVFLIPIMLYAGFMIKSMTKSNRKSDSSSEGFSEREFNS